MRKSIASLLIIIALLLSCCACAEVSDWTTFFLMCNEGMRNDGDNVGNTLMVVSMNPDEGRIKQLMFTWDTFIDYEGYDIPQLLDKPFRVNGPAETMKVFNKNFGQDIQTFMSLNYLNLSALIDDYGGVEVDITRAERNALNGMIANKTSALKQDVPEGYGQVQDILASWTSEEGSSYYLQDYGEDTHLNGMQAVAFGWLQYDSVYNCCLREVDVIADLFYRVGQTIDSRVAFYDESGHIPEGDDRRVVNLDEMTDADVAFLRELVDPIFELSYNNLTDEQINDITVAIAKAAYKAKQQGVDMFEKLEIEVMPLEKLEPYEKVAGVEGHVIDKAANAKAITEFLFDEA